jgi:hypothetical protein
MTRGHAADARSKRKEYCPNDQSALVCFNEMAIHLV